MTDFYIEVRDCNGTVVSLIELKATNTQHACIEFDKKCRFYDSSHSVTLHRVA